MVYFKKITEDAAILLLNDALKPESPMNTELPLIAKRIPDENDNFIFSYIS